MASSTGEHRQKMIAHWLLICFDFWDESRSCCSFASLMPNVVLLSLPPSPTTSPQLPFSSLYVTAPSTPARHCCFPSWKRKLCVSVAHCHSPLTYVCAPPTPWETACPLIFCLLVLTLLNTKQCLLKFLVDPPLLTSLERQD